MVANPTWAVITHAGLGTSVSVAPTAVASWLARGWTLTTPGSVNADIFPELDTQTASVLSSTSSLTRAALGPAIIRRGNTASRPTPASVGTGGEYFDTTLNKPIWVNTAGTGWVDATGTAA